MTSGAAWRLRPGAAGGAGRAFLELDLRTAEFDYDLPRRLIAQRPLAERSASRMLVVDRRAGDWHDSRVAELPDWLRQGDCLVVNDTRVIPARLVGRRVGQGGEPGGSAEVLLLEPDGESEGDWRALVRPGRRLRPGSAVVVAGTRIRVGERLGDGVRRIRFETGPGFCVERFAGDHGEVPLPPYIRREVDESDKERYQTAFARRPGSVAAPTAGLHFDGALLRRLQTHGVGLAKITLHVGLGTFRPVGTGRVEDHRMHSERFEVMPEAAEAIGAAGRIVAVGTTCVRTLETVAARGGGSVSAMYGDTDLFIRPGHEFLAVDGLLTNFHLPRSTLLMLVAAFAGKDLVLAAYAHAVREDYRFYSYGDCMLVL